MTDDEIDAAILAALKLPATNVFPVGDDERIIFLAGYRAGIEAAAEWVEGRIHDQWKTMALGNTIRALAD